jgi:ribosomal protein S18 acetylase RimI-like enzyme
MHKTVHNIFQEIKDQYIKPYSKPRYVFKADKGFIVWRLGTGENVELLHIRTLLQRKGQGRELFYMMLDSLKVEMTPYYSVFGFTRVSNDRAKEFYEGMGFNIQPIKGLYADGEAVMFWQEYTKLLEWRKDWDINENFICG